MTRDTTLLSKILYKAQHGASTAEPIEIQITGYAPGVVSEHIHLAVEAGYIDAERRDVSEGPIQWRVQRLTWKGHEELERLQGNRVHRIERG